MHVDTLRLQKLREIVVDLNVQWQMFDDLFSDQKNYVILNRAGRNFWCHLHSYLLDTVLLSISRLFDSKKSCSQNNFSLLAVLDFQEVAAIREDLEKRLNVMRPIWDQRIKVWRHKKLSHSDMPTVLNDASLPEIPFSEVKELVYGISEFAREIDHQLNKTDVNYRIGISEWIPQVLQFLDAGIQKTDKDRKGRGIER